MKSITLNGIDVNYNLAFKKNKNTYFYFKDEGHIQINASKYQTEAQIVKHMLSNSSVFLSKLAKVQNRKTINDPNAYYLWGSKLKRQNSEDGINKIHCNDEFLFEPSLKPDQLSKEFKRYETELVINELNNIYKKHMDNPYVNIKDINLKTRYTKTRFGSCNAVKRNININTHLLHYDIVYLEYVFLHEISHLTHQNHGPKFYLLLEKLCPNYKQLRKELKASFRR